LKKSASKRETAGGASFLGSVNKNSFIKSNSKKYGHGGTNDDIDDIKVIKEDLYRERKKNIDL
jgi:hypothetical protein